MNKMLSLFVLLAASTIAFAEPDPEPPKPCSADAYRQFDFWLGDWESFGPKGQKQGENRLHKVMGDCAIQENWTGRGGVYQGTSFNFFNATTGQWHQTWIDNQGGHLFLKGGLVDGSMQLSGDGKSPQGNDIINRITWTPLEDGRVRQHWQASGDGGETWTEVFDGYYQRKGSP